MGSREQEKLLSGPRGKMLKELIDKFYLEQKKSKRQYHFYISDAGKCDRAIFFKFKNLAQEKLDARILRIFEQGEYFHRSLINILIRLGIIVAAEINIPPQEIISGRADAILSVDNEIYILDIKSMNSIIFRKLTQPKEANIYQLQLYMHYFNIKKGILLYVDKDRQELKEFVINYNAELCKRLIAKFKSLQTKINSDNVPMVLSDYPRNWQCRYCPFRLICKIAGKEQIKWQDFKSKIKKQN